MILNVLMVDDSVTVLAHRIEKSQLNTILAILFCLFVSNPVGICLLEKLVCFVSFMLRVCTFKYLNNNNK